MKKFTLLFLVMFFVTGSFSTFAQSVGINKDGSTPNSSAILDVQSNSQGMLMPRLTTTERDGILSPAIGLFIFNTTTNCFEAYVNGAWNSVSCPSACTPPPIPTSSSAGSITCTSFTANWASSTGASSYFLDVATDVAFTTFAPGYINLNVGNLTSYSVLGLTASTTYYYRVRAATACTSGSSSPITVATLPVPVQPSVIAGTATVCQGNSSVAYAVTTVADVAYTWSYSGAGYTQASGGTTNSITANFSASATSGTLTVTPSNGCGNGTARTYDITVNSKPAQPSAITGTTPVCQGTNGVAYSVNSVAGVTYTWSYSGTGYTQATGTNTNSITANFSASATSGTLTVTPHNDCGDGAARTYDITINSAPSQPSAITGSASACQGASGVAYSVTNVPGVTYTWTYPDGTGYTQVSGTNTNSITADFSALATSGTLTVTPSNTCGTGTVRTLAITANSVPASPTAAAHTPSATQIIWNWNAVSGATAYKWNTTNDYATATTTGSSISYTQTGLTCNTSYTLYVWAYNACFNSVSPITLTQTSGACSITYNYTGAQQTFTVPAGINSLNVSLYGASGTQSNNGSQDGAPGKGGLVQTTLAVTPGSTLYIYVGGQSNWNGGGQKGLDPVTTWYGGVGGDASDIRVGGNLTGHRVIVAGGGGGSGGSPVYPGKGAAGGYGGNVAGSGANGEGNGWNGLGPNGGKGGTGATIYTYGNAGDGSNGGGTDGTRGNFALGGDGGYGYFVANPSYQNGGNGGGGGGGYYGGGGGAGGSHTGGGGGGGGSSYAGAGTSATTYTDDNNTGVGKLIISY